MAQSSSPSIAERLRAAANKAASRPETTVGFQQRTATATAAQAQTQGTPQIDTRHQEEIEQAAKSREEFAAKIKENPFYQAFEENSQLTQEEQINLLSNALDPKQHTKEEVEKSLEQAEEYFTYIQSDELERILEGVKRNVQELKEQEKIENRKAAENVRAMLNNIKVAQGLLEVLRRCRLNGTTVKEFWAAMDRQDEINDQLVELKGGTRKKTGLVVKGALAEAQEALDDVQKVVDARIKEREEKEAGFWFKARNILKTDTTYSKRVSDAEAARQNKEAALNQIKGQVAELEAQRDEEFEKEPLIFLRSLDEASDNLTERLIGIGESGIDTIHVSQDSMDKLLGRANLSERDAIRVAERIAAREILLKNFRAGMTIATKNTNTYEGELEEQRQAAEADLAAARTPAEGEPDDMQIAKLDDTATRLKNQSGDVQDYKVRLNGLIGAVNGAFSDNTRRAQEADSQKRNVRASKESIGSFKRGTLNVIANTLESTMQSMRNDQTDETRHTFDALGEEAITAGFGLSEHMLQRKQEMAAEQAALYEAAAKRLHETAELITRSVEMDVEQGAKIAAGQEGLAVATQEVDEAVTTQRTVAATLSSDATGRALRPGAPQPKPGGDAPAP